MQAQRTFCVVWVSAVKPTAYDLDATPAKTVAYSGASVTMKMEWFIGCADKRLSLQAQ